MATRPVRTTEINYAFLSIFPVFSRQPIAHSDTRHYIVMLIEFGRPSEPGQVSWNLSIYSYWLRRDRQR